MSKDLSDWQGCPPPERVTLKGERVHLTPPSVKDHTQGLFELISLPGEDFIWTYMPAGPYHQIEDFRATMKEWATMTERFHYTIVEAKSGRPLGMMSLMNIEPAQGAIEIDFIWFHQTTAANRGCHRSAVPDDGLRLKYPGLPPAGMEMQ